jgi:regulator of sirC expression with transglutaminase-like and TPR domain
VVAGPGASLVPELHLRPAAPREILVRMLTNLKQLYARARDFGRTLGCCERILLLSPDASHELRDRLRTLRARRMH